MKWLKRKSINTPTRLLYKFQEHRKDPPGGAIQTTLSKWRVNESRTFGERDDVHCPECSRVNQLKHGDRILCGCGTMMETYGNSLVYWDQKLRTESHEYDRVDPATLRPTIVDMLVGDPEIRAAYEKFPAVKDGIEELATLIKLHEDIDTD